MVRYQYFKAMRPPAPFVHVSVKNLATEAVVHGIPAQIDTAADCTVIPLNLANTLGLQQIGAVKIGGVGNSQDTMPVHLVEIAIHDFPPKVIEVVSNASEEWILLGRDVLNDLHLSLDGPKLAIEIH